MYLFRKCISDHIIYEPDLAHSINSANERGVRWIPEVDVLHTVPNSKAGKTDTSNYSGEYREEKGKVNRVKVTRLDKFCLCLSRAHGSTRREQDLGSMLRGSRSFSISFPFCLAHCTHVYAMCFVTLDRSVIL